MEALQRLRTVRRHQTRSGYLSSRRAADRCTAVIEFKEYVEVPV